MHLDPSVSDWLVPLASTIFGALIGAGLSLWVSLVLARRERRARYGESLIAALVSAREKVHAAQTKLSAEAGNGSAVLTDPLMLHQDAAAVRSRAALLSTLESSEQGRRAIAAWAFHIHESLLGGAQRLRDVEPMLGMLSVGEDVVVAWITCRATGVDFKLSIQEAGQRFGERFTDADMPPPSGIDS